MSISVHMSLHPRVSAALIRKLKEWKVKDKPAFDIAVENSAAKRRKQREKKTLYYSKA